MGYKCAPQLLGLTIGEPPAKTNKKTGKKYKNRHRANGEAIAKEMFEERASRSDTLDRSRSHLNSYEGFGRGADCWNDMLQDVAEYKMPVKLKNGQTAYRKLGGRQLEELVPGWSIIINPPPEMTVGWTDDDYDRFEADSMEVLAELCPIFKPKNIKGKAIHRDEGREDVNGEFGRHTHYIGNCWDDEGRYCGSVINGLLYDEINRRYPELMRAKGWDLEDLDVTDWARMKEDDEYRAEREQKRRTKGRSVNQVIADEQHAARIDAAMARTEARSLRAEVEQLEQLAGTILTDAMDRATEITTEARRDARAARLEADQDREQAKRDRDAAWWDAQDIRDEANEYAQAVRDDANEYARATRTQADQDRQLTAQDAEAIRDAARRDAERTAAEAAAQAEAVREAIRQKIKAEVDEAKQERDKAVTARRAAQAALQGDYKAWAADTRKPTATALLGVLNAAVEASREKPPASTGVGRAWEQLQHMMAARDAKPGPAAVEGPTL